MPRKSVGAPADKGKEQIVDPLIALLKNHE